MRSVQPVLAEVNRSCEEAALTLGASRLQIFRRVILPEIAPALAAGTVLAFCRSLGEFGAIIFISGNIAFETEVLSLAIFMRLQEFDYPAASAIASVVLGLSLVLFIAANQMLKRFARRIGSPS